MSRFAEPVFIAAGLRTPFGRGGGALAAYDAISLSVPVVQAMAAQAEPDLLVWGTVIPNLGWSNIARETWLDAKLNPTVPAFSVVLACSTSMTATFAAAGMLGGGTDLTMVGGSEVMSRPSIALTADASKRLTDLFAQDATAALAALQSLTPRDYVLPTKGWANRITGRTMGDHMEETAKAWRVSRVAQDDWALKSHQRAVAGWERGFFDDLVISLPELARDANPRADTSPERLAALKPAFDRDSGRGTLTAGNSTPLTDGASSVLLASEEWAKARGLPVLAYLTYGKTASVDFVAGEGLLMAPTVAVARMLADTGLSLQDFDFYEIHEAFAAQVLCTLRAWESDKYCKQRLGLTQALGRIDPAKLNVKGSSLAFGHPFAATGGRIVATLAKLLDQRGSGRGLISVCTAGGMGVVAMLEKN